jgi:hypothetical protein
MVVFNQEVRYNKYINNIKYVDLTGGIIWLKLFRNDLTVRNKFRVPKAIMEGILDEKNC